MSLYSRMINKIILILNKIRIFHLKILGAKVGNNVKSFGRFTIMNPINLEIGANSTLNEGVHINCRSKVIIGNNVHISSNVQIHAGKLLINKSNRIHTSSAIVIEDDVWLASSVVVSAGVRIGKGSVIAANSVVIKNIPNSVFAGGIPAEVIKFLEN